MRRWSRRSNDASIYPINKVSVQTIENISRQRDRFRNAGTCISKTLLIEIVYKHPRCTKKQGHLCMHNANRSSSDNKNIRAGMRSHTLLPIVYTTQWLNERCLRKVSSIIEHHNIALSHRLSRHEYILSKSPRNRNSKGPIVRTCICLTRNTQIANAATKIRRHRNMLPDTVARHTVTNPFDNTRELMAQNEGMVRINALLTIAVHTHIRAAN